MEGLTLRDKVSGLKFPRFLLSLSGESLKIVMERSPGWEYRFFSSVLSDEMRTDQELKWDLKYGLTIGRVHPLSELQKMLDWVGLKLNDVGALVNSADTLMNKVVQDGLGKSGHEGDPELLFYCAHRIAQVRKELVKWSLEFGCTEVGPECKHLLELISQMSAGVIENLESIPGKLDAEINKVLEAKAKGESYVGELMLKLTIPFADELHAEFEKLTQIAHLANC
jgi:hypothetical protein